MNARLILILFATFVSRAFSAPTTDTSTKTPRMLKEVIVKTKKHQVLHIVAYVRDYSTLTTYGDTVTMYREKWVDFMLPSQETKKFEGWRSPRILKARSYYNFKNTWGLDSVSDNCNQHFSWSDWVGIIDNIEVPMALQTLENATDTIFGRYSPTEIWTRHGDNMSLKVDVLADTSSQRWAPDFTSFFRNKLDFEKFKITYEFRDVYKKIYARDLVSISCNIESNGRGRDMFMFNRRDEPFFVTTNAQFYIIDREFLTVSDAKKWRKNNVKDSDWIYEVPDSLPELSPQTLDLIARVDNIDKQALRLAWNPNPIFVAKHRRIVPLHKRYFKFLKSIIGLK